MDIDPDDMRDLADDVKQRFKDGWTRFKGISRGDRIGFVGDKGVMRWGWAWALHADHVMVETSGGQPWCCVTDQNFRENKGPGALVRGWPA